MYIALNNERIILNFNGGINLKMSGPDHMYYVELKEYVKNDEFPYTVESYRITPTGGRRQAFNVPIEFQGNWEILVFKFIENHGMKLIYNHRYCDYGKLVKFYLETKDFNEATLWSKRVDEYSRIHGCIPLVDSNFDEINKSYTAYYNIPGIDIYKTYKIGRYPKSSSDFRTIDHRKEGLIWFGNWKTFWSYQHPRKWTELTSQEIVDDILGLY